MNRNHHALLASYSYTHNVLSTGYPFLEALACISHVADDIVVLDGHSNDGTLRELERLAGLLGNLRLFQCKDLWTTYWDIGRSENTAQQYTHAEFLIRLHLDEVLDLRTIHGFRPSLEGPHNSYACREKTLVSPSQVGQSRLPREGFRIFRASAQVQSVEDGFLRGKLEPSIPLDLTFYHLNWYLPFHWVDKTNALGPLWNWQGLFSDQIFGLRRNLKPENMSRDERLQLVTQFEEAANIVPDDPPWYLSSLDQDQKYSPRWDVIQEILSYDTSNPQ